jgi:hypothetical protein
MLQIAHLLTLADEYQRHDPVEDKTLSFRVFGDSKKLSSLRVGADLTTSRFNLALSWFDDNWPQMAVWPDEVPRPTTPSQFDGLNVEPAEVAQ